MLDSDAHRALAVRAACRLGTEGDRRFCQDHTRTRVSLTPTRGYRQGQAGSEVRHQQQAAGMVCLL